MRTGPIDGIQLGAIVLFDLRGRLLPVASVSNPGGANPGRQTPDKLVAYQDGAALTDLDADYTQSIIRGSHGKWFDGNFATGSQQAIIDLSLAAPAHVGSHWFLTAPDVARRDPVEWSLLAQLANGESQQLHSVSAADPNIDKPLS